MAVQDRRRQLRFSTKLKESPYGTAQARDCLIRFNKTTTTEPDDVIDNDADLLGPTMEPNEQESVAIAEMMSVSRRYCTLHEALFIIAFGLGKITSAQIGSLASAYSHKIRMSDEVDLPAFSYSELIDAGAANNANKGILVAGVGITQFSLNANRGGDRRVELSASVLGKSRADWPADTNTELAKASGGPTLDGGASDIWTGTGVNASVNDTMFGATGGDAARSSDLADEDKISDLVMAIGWSFDNASNKDDNYRMGGGAEMSTMERGESPNHEVTLTLEYKNQDVLKKFRSQGAFALQWKVAAGGTAQELGEDASKTYHFGLNLIWPNLQYSGYTPGRQGAKRTIDVTLKPLPQSVNNSVYANGYNKQATYAG